MDFIVNTRFVGNLFLDVSMTNNDVKDGRVVIWRGVSHCSA